MAGKKRVGAAKGRAKKKQAPPAYGGKTAFVLGMPSDVSAKEVVVRAKAQGMTLSEAYIYKIRSSRKAKRSPAKPTAPAPAASTLASGPAAVAFGGQTASDFVRALPGGVSAKEAVQRAKEAGISLTTGYYYTLRSSLGLAGGRAARAGARTNPPAAARLKLASQDRHEQAVIEAVEALGIERILYVVDAVQRLHG